MCGCKKSAPVTRVPTIRPASTPRPLIGGLAAGATPAQIRALGMQANVTPKSAMQLTAERRKIEKIKRDAIKAKLNQ